MQHRSQEVQFGVIQHQPPQFLQSVVLIQKTMVSGKSYISYCFAPIQGYSKFGSYEGNASDNGNFIYTGL